MTEYVCVDETGWRLSDPNKQFLQDISIVIDRSIPEPNIYHSPPGALG